MRNFTVLLTSVTLFCAILCPPAMAYKYRHENLTKENREYIYHHFTFNSSELQEMSRDYRKCQGYAEGMVQTIWDLAKGMGSDLGRFVGRVWLGDQLHRMAKGSLAEGQTSMEVLIRSRADEGGKWALEFGDQIADVWNKLTGDSV